MSNVIYTDDNGREHWQLNNMSCGDGANYGWTRTRFHVGNEDPRLNGEGGDETAGCVCHHNPPKNAVVTSRLFAPVAVGS